jgi:DNA-binding protein Fis
MKCPKCQSENPEGNRFCGECGGNLEIVCPGCNSSNPAEFKFCGKCGSELPPPRKSRQNAPNAKARPIKVGAKHSRISDITFKRERNKVLALLSDLSGYAALTERLDTGEAKEIASKIFDSISKLISKYEDLIEKLTGESQGLESEPFTTLKQMEKKHILNAYNKLNKNKSQTARMLGISVNTLKSKLKSYGVGEL